MIFALNDTMFKTFSGDFDDDNLFSDLRIGDERDDEKDVFA